MSNTHSQRCRWRAELCRFGAAVAREDIPNVSPTTAALLEANASKAEAEAELHVLDAEITEQVIALKERWRAGEITKAQYNAEALPLVAVRTFWRKVGEATGTRNGQASSVDNFSEPSDSELAEMEF